MYELDREEREKERGNERTNLWIFDRNGLCRCRFLFAYFMWPLATGNRICFIIFVVVEYFEFSNWCCGVKITQHTVSSCKRIGNNMFYEINCFFSSLSVRPSQEYSVRHAMSEYRSSQTWEREWETNDLCDVYLVVIEYVENSLFASKPNPHHPYIFFTLSPSSSVCVRAIELVTGCSVRIWVIHSQNKTNKFLSRLQATNRTMDNNIIIRITNWSRAKHIHLTQNT